MLASIAAVLGTLADLISLLPFVGRLMPPVRVSPSHVDVVQGHRLTARISVTNRTKRVVYQVAIDLEPRYGRISATAIQFRPVGDDRGPFMNVGGNVVSADVMGFDMSDKKTAKESSVYVLYSLGPGETREFDLQLDGSDLADGIRERLRIRIIRHAKEPGSLLHWGPR